MNHSRRRQRGNEAVVCRRLRVCPQALGLYTFMNVDCSARWARENRSWHLPIQCRWVNLKYLTYQLKVTLPGTRTTERLLRGFINSHGWLRRGPDRCGRQCCVSITTSQFIIDTAAAVAAACTRRIIIKFLWTTNSIFTTFLLCPFAARSGNGER